MLIKRLFITIFFLTVYVSLTYTQIAKSMKEDEKEVFPAQPTNPVGEVLAH